MTAQESWPATPEPRPVDAWLADVDPWDDEPQPDLGERVWADRQLARLRRLDHEENGIIEIAKARIAEIEHWRDGIVGRLENRQSEIERSLEAWMRDVADREHVKTITLPSGVLRLRGGPDAKGYHKLEIVGDEQAIAESLPDALVKTKRELRRGDIKAAVVPFEVVKSDAVPDGYTAHKVALPEIGQVVEGVYLLVPNRTSFTCTPNTTEVDQ